MIRCESVKEIFYSLQGEGEQVGRPMVFIRFNECNKSCYFCDTDFRGGLKSEDFSRLMKTVVKSDRDVCFTGGEPFLFAEEIKGFIGGETLSGRQYFGETNGSVMDEDLFRLVGWHISPKNIEDVETAIAGCRLNGDNRIKLVFGTEDFLLLWESISGRVDKDRIIIMPKASCVQELIENSNPAKEFCLASGCRFSSRLHVVHGWR